MPDYGHVVGSLFSHQMVNDRPVPLKGKLFFTPSHAAFTGGVFYGATPIIGHLIEGTLMDAPARGGIGVHLLAPGTYRVTGQLTSDQGAALAWEPTDIQVTAGTTLSITASVGPDGEVDPVVSDLGDGTATLSVPDTTVVDHGDGTATLTIGV